MKVTTLVAVIVVIVLVVAGGLVMSRRQHKAPRDFDDEDKIIGEVDVYLAYGRSEEAREILQEAVRLRPSSARYREKLEELERGAG